MASVFYSLSEKILLEIDYTQVGINNQNHPLELINDDNATTKTLVNVESGVLATNNIGATSLVTTPNNKNVILDNNTGYFYPNVDPNVYITSIPTSNISLKYVSVRLHILSGYNFQDAQGITFSLYVKGVDGDKIYLLNQSFLKSQINRYRYNDTPKKIGILYYDKFLEFNVIDYDDVITGGINSGFFSNTIAFSNENVMYASSSQITSIDYSEGYPIVSEEDGKSISFAPKDEFDLLSANITEHPNGYFQYQAMWNGQPIENVIFGLNSLSGNDYYVIHDLEVYEQRGLSLLLIDSLSIPQIDNYDTPKKFRPIISQFATGGMKIVYTVRLFNRVSGDSVIKTSTISTLNTTTYLEEIGKLSIVQLDAPVKVYNKIKSSTLDVKSNDKIGRVLVPIYVNSFSASTDVGFEMKLVQFDNVYEIKVFNIVDGEKSLYFINPLFKHSLVFVKENGNKIVVKELVDNAKRNVGILTFKILADVSNVVRANGITRFNITVDSDGIETSLLAGDVNYQ